MWLTCLLHGNAAGHTPATDSAVELLRMSYTRVEGWIGLGLLILFFLSFRSIRQFLQLSFSGLILFRVAQKQFEENSVLITNIRQMLLIFSQICISFFLFLTIQYYDILPASLTPVQGYFIILLSLFLFYIFKIFVIRILGFLTETETAIHMIGYYGQLYAISGGIMLFPFTMVLFNSCSSFCKPLIIIGLLCSLTLILLYMMRCFQIFIFYKLSVFFWILYLCTFECVPFLLIWKYITLT
jgi:hypothetical protein